MTTRTYNNEKRRWRQAELKAGIAAATAELHASKGVIATSYADIARHAGVSLPTVYSHFPTQDDLLQGCTAHVIAQAPALPTEKILAAPDLPAAANLLVTAMEAQHLHFEPWSAWREDRVIPLLGAMAAAIRQSKSELIAAVLARHDVPGAHREQVAAWESVLSFDMWHRLVREHGLSRSAVRRILVQWLLAVVGPTPAPSLTQGPRRTT
ncbi:MAG TPA: TetR/AcrR family transcriptional regulator [Rhodocyclaceae bacterium]|nr:TetR/AcrR family transcriptional regulator [Rhodocyclaceae bacterium]HRQ47324.1 TetR/AcrR family transcriptional regulator [Rhodocyclaceae bacterium]